MVKVLILDGDTEYAGSLAKDIESLGHKASIAETIAAAREQIAVEDFDGFMVEPQMSNGVYAGLDFVDELLFDGVPKHRVVALTGVHMVELARQCAQMRIAMRIKPIELPGLETLLERWSKRTEADRARDEVF